MLSTIILTKNSQNTIKKTVDSVLWSDEIIIIDDESSDETLHIIQHKNVHRYIHPLQDDFASQRNFGLQKAKGEWVLFIDSDEIISNELKMEIQTIIGNNKPNNTVQNIYQGFFIRRIDILWGKELRFGETGNIKFLRIAKKGSGNWKNPVHEYWEIKGKTDTLVSPIYHYPHETITQFLRQINWYSSIRAKYLFENGIKEHPIMIFGKPFGKCVFNLIVLQGFRDGTIGIIHAILMSFHSFLVRAKLWQLHNS
jgi:glycosyltransferase involved in cell wall biosynthesis